MPSSTMLEVRSITLVPRTSRHRVAVRPASSLTVPRAEACGYKIQKRPAWIAGTLFRFAVALAWGAGRGAADLLGRLAMEPELPLHPTFLYPTVVRDFPLWRIFNEL